VVHAKGAGAYGVFAVTHDITDIVSPSLLLSTECIVLQLSYSVLRTCSTRSANRLTSLLASPPLAERKGPLTAHEIQEEYQLSSTPKKGTGTGCSTIPRSSLSVIPHCFLSSSTHKSGILGRISDASYFWDCLSSHQESIHQVMYTFSD
jgi:catalase